MILKFTKYILTFIVAFISSFLTFSYSYFQDKYYCKIENNSITVSLKEKNKSFEKCMNTIKDAKNSIAKIENNISNVDSYIKRKENTNYWLNIRNKLEDTKSSLISFRENIFSSMENFEQGLFEDIKKILDYKLKKTKNNLNISYENLENMKKNAIRDGDIEKLKYFRKKIRNVSYKISLINSIFKSNDFRTLMPLLRAYINK